jgi:hypothetical protein
MTLDLDELESKAKAATRGPWKCVARPEALLLGVQSVDGVPISVIAGDRPLTDMRQAIADNYYIAAACNSVPALIAHIRELEAEKEALLEINNVQTDELARLRSENSELKITGNAIYDAAYWTADRPVNQELLWTNFRNALGRNQGNSPKPVNIANE